MHYFLVQCVGRDIWPWGGEKIDDDDEENRGIDRGCLSQSHTKHVHLLTLGQSFYPLCPRSTETFPLTCTLNTFVDLYRVTRGECEGVAFVFFICHSTFIDNMHHLLDLISPFLLPD